jgi:hypothetical protein
MDVKNIFALSVAAALAPAVLDHAIDSEQSACYVAIPAASVTANSLCPVKAAVMSHDEPKAASGLLPRREGVAEITEGPDVMSAIGAKWHDQAVQAVAFPYQQLQHGNIAHIAS